MSGLRIGVGIVTLGLSLASCSDDEVEDPGTGGGAATGAAAGAAGASGGSGGVGASGGASGAGGAAGDGGGAGSPADAGSDAPGDAGALPATLASGVWLFGWTGALEHYSWVRFTPSAPGSASGTWSALDTTCTACTPYLACEGGPGTYDVSGAVLALTLPPACGDAGVESWSFLSIDPPGSYPPGALMQASIEVNASPAQPLAGFLYPASQCNAGFTNCTDPF